MLIFWQILSIIILPHIDRYVCVGIEGAFYEPGQKTVIPCKVTGKFSIRIVPDMSPEKVTELVCKHVNNIWAVRGSPNDMK